MISFSGEALDYCMRAGDVITIDLPVRRKWWQFWKPRWIYPARQRTFVISSVGSSTIRVRNEAD